MRHQNLFAALAGLLAAAAPVLAQTNPGVAIVQQDVEVRSGPSQTFFATSKLLRGDKVIVIRECKGQPGWLEIQPPPHSFSWINASFAKQLDARVGYVDGDPARPAPVMPGSNLENQKPQRESIKLTAGTIIIIVAQPQKIGDETWLPILPHPSEVRYLPATAVKPATQIAATATSAPNWALMPGGYTTDAMLADAETARKIGDMNKARQLYTQVANNSTNPNQKTYAMNQLYTLPQGGQPSPSPSYSPFQAASVQKPQPPTTAYSPGNPVPPAAAPANLITMQGPAWSGYGRLRETTLKRDDGQPIYVLENTQGGLPVAYVTTDPGKSLQGYLGRIVTVYGPKMYRSDSKPRLEYIVASHVAMP